MTSFAKDSLFHLSLSLPLVRVLLLMSLALTTIETDAKGAEEVDGGSPRNSAQYTEA